MKTERIIIRINSELKEEFKRRCELKDKSMSQTLTEYIEWVNQKPE